MLNSKTLTNISTVKVFKIQSYNKHFPKTPLKIPIPFKPYSSVTYLPLTITYIMAFNNK